MEDVYDMDSVDTQATEDNNSVQDVEDVPTIEEYWSFPKEDLASFLQLASLFSWRGGRDLTAKSVSLSTSDDGTHLICRATDFDSYISVKIPLKSDNPITQIVIFPTTTLLKCIPQCSKTMVLKKDAFLVKGQWVGIEPVVLDPHLFINSDPIIQMGELHIPSLTSLIPIASSSTIPRDRNIRFYKDYIQSTYLWTEIRIPFSSSMDFILSAREASLVKSIGRDINLGITHADIPRLVIQSPTTTLWIIHREPETKNTDISLPEWSLQMDSSELSRLVSMSESLPSSTGILQFEYANDFIITYTSKLTNNPFVIPVQITGTPTQLSPSNIQAKILKMYIKSLSDKYINVSWDSTSLFFQCSQCTVALKWEAQ